jgi:hypothetical protein
MNFIFGLILLIVICWLVDKFKDEIKDEIRKGI